MRVRNPFVWSVQGAGFLFPEDVTEHIGSRCDPASAKATFTRIPALYQTTYIIERMKTLRFVGSSLDDLKNFPAEASPEAGSNWMRCSGPRCLPTKPMLAVRGGRTRSGVRVLGEWRIIYVASSSVRYMCCTPSRRRRRKRKEDIRAGSPPFLGLWRR